MPWTWPKLHSEASHDDAALSLSILSAHISNDHTAIHLALVHATQSTPSDPLDLDLQHFASLPLPADLTASLQSLDQIPQAPLHFLSELDAKIGHFTASAISSFSKTSGFSIDDDAELIAFQGAALTDLNCTLGATSTITARTGTTTIGNFRYADSNSRNSDVFTALHRVTSRSEPVLPQEMYESVSLAFGACEAFLGRPVLGLKSVGVDDGLRVHGQIQLGDNHLEVWGKVLRFWNEWPLDRCEATRAVDICVSC